MVSNEDAILILSKKFSDLINYESEDPSAPIDPRTYRTPEGDNILHYAVMRGDLESVKLALQIGIDVNSTGDLGNNALHYAGMFKSREIYDYLVNVGADENTANELDTKPTRPSVLS